MKMLLGLLLIFFALLINTGNASVCHTLDKTICGLYLSDHFQDGQLTREDLSNIFKHFPQDLMERYNKIITEKGKKGSEGLLQNTKSFLNELKDKLPTTTVGTITAQNENTPSASVGTVAVSNGKTAVTITPQNGKKATVKESPSETSTITLSNGNRITCRL